MANSDTPFGFKPVRHMIPGAHISVNSIKGKPYTCATTYGTAIFKGDAVIPVAAGGIEAAAADAGVLVCGVAQAFRWKDAAGDFHEGDYIPATKTGFTEIEIDVMDDPNVIFEVQADDGGSSTVAESARFAVANHVAGAGSTTTGISGHELDASDVGTGLQLRILDKCDASRYNPNDWASLHTKLLVMFNEHFYSTGGGATV